MRVLLACIFVWAEETMEISTGASTRRPERLSSHDDRLVAAAAVQNRLEGVRSRRSTPSTDNSSMAANTARLKGSIVKQMLSVSQSEENVSALVMFPCSHVLINMSELGALDTYMTSLMQVLKYSTSVFVLGGYQ